LNVQVLGISVDHVPSLQAWDESLEGITYPLLSDFWPHGEVAEKYGVLRDDGRSERAIFIVDKEGVIQYIDIHDIDDQPDNEVLFAELGRIDPNPTPASAASSSEDEELPKGGVVLYCTSWCPSCRRARQWLGDNGIEYIEIDVNRNRKAASQVREWAGGNLTTPTIDVDGTIVVEWNQKRMEELLLKK
jgi:glutaredoxin